MFGDKHDYSQTGEYSCDSFQILHLVVATAHGLCRCGVAKKQPAGWSGSAAVIEPGTVIGFSKAAVEWQCVIYQFHEA